MIITVTAPSGVGKSTFMRTFLHHSNIGARMLTSSTTRKARGSDLPLEYEYISEETYDSLLASGAFLKEFGKYGNRYGTRVSYFNDAAFFKGEPYLAALLPEALPLFQERAQALGSYKGEIRYIYLDLTDEAEHARRLIERGETNLERFADDLKNWREEVEAFNLPLLRVDAAQEPIEMVNEVLQRLQLRA